MAVMAKLLPLLRKKINNSSLILGLLKNKEANSISSFQERDPIANYINKTNKADIIPILIS